MTSKDPFYKRIGALNEKPMAKGDYIVYWMQASQRVEDNHALAHAIELANAKKLPLVVVFGLMDNYPEANLRHYTFMLEGLRETFHGLKRMGIRMVVHLGHPTEIAAKISEHAAMAVTDMGYLGHQRNWRERFAQKTPCRVVRVESDVVVPVETVSDKHEYAARTIRPKIHRLLPDFLVSLKTPEVNNDSLHLFQNEETESKLDHLLDRLDLDRSVKPVTHFFKGGTQEAKRRFKKFLDKDLENYDQNSNQPQTDHISHMSPYLHFGQISPLYLALEAEKRKDTDPDGRFLEQLIVRRELSINHAYFEPRYDRFDSLPGWAIDTLTEHAEDKREPLYDPETMESAKTHDRYWNAAMNEMKYTGFMHNYMRMYWGKKIMQWSDTPEKAFDLVLYLNNKYFLDGRDPNSYAGVGWIFGLHDRPWKERPIFGKVRYMAASGLERKCDIKAYVEKVRDRIKIMKDSG